jgi:outer membrane protein assembly factor BamB
MGGMRRPGGGGGAPPAGDDDGPRGGGALFALKAGASGDITLKDKATSNDGVAWSKSKAGPSMASPLLYKGQVYILEQRGGMLSAYDAKTGKEVYSKERIAGARGFTASPLASDDKIFCTDDSGTTFVIQAGGTYKLLGKNSLNEVFWSTPSASGGDLFLRGVDHLFCIKP